MSNETIKLERDADGKIVKGGRKKLFFILAFPSLLVIAYLVSVMINNSENKAKVAMLEAANAKASQLEIRNKELESANKALGETLQKTATQNAIAKTVPPTSIDLPNNPDGGEWTVLLHTLAEDDQIAIEEEETAAAFKKCSAELDMTLTPCASVIKDQKRGNGYNLFKASLAKTKDGMPLQSALKVAMCFNRNMKLAKKKDGTVMPNAADAIKLWHFEPECLAAK